MAVKGPIYVGLDYAWLATEGASFRLMGPTKRVFVALAVAREETPGRALSSDELIAAGWPGEKIVPEAALGRLYTALSALRRHGLRDALIRDRRRGGYRLDEEVAIDRETRVTGDVVA